MDKEKYLEQWRRHPWFEVTDQPDGECHIRMLYPQKMKLITDEMVLALSKGLDFDNVFLIWRGKNQPEIDAIRVLNNRILCHRDIKIERIPLL